MNSYVKKLLIIPQVDLEGVKKQLNELGPSFSEKFNVNTKKSANEFKNSYGKAILTIKEQFVDSFFPKSEIQQQIDDISNNIAKLSSKMTERNLGISSVRKKLTEEDESVYTKLKAKELLESKQAKLEESGLSGTKTYNELQSKIKSITKEIQKLSVSGELTELLKLESLQTDDSEELNQLLQQRQTLQLTGKNEQVQSSSKAMFDALKEKSLSILKDIGNTIVSGIKTLFEEGIAELKKMTSYNLNTSLQINSEAREQAMQYGLSADENYAFTKVKEEMGIQSEADLYYMNENQREKFAERMGYYSGQYNKLNNQGFFKTYEQFNQEMIEFKNEITMDFIEWFVGNKDTITAVMKAAMDFMKTTLEILGWFAKALGSDTRSENEKGKVTSDLINSYMTTSNTKNTSVKQDNTFNVNSSEKANEMSKYSNLTYQQLIDTLNRM